MTWDGDGIDPWLPERLNAELDITRAERRLFDSWFASISRWLVQAKRAVLAGPGVDAAAVFGRADEWAAEMDRFVQGPVLDTMGTTYRQLFGDGYRYDNRPAVVDYLANVRNRMVRTPDEVYGLIAGQVAHGAAIGSSIDDITAEVDTVLSATGTERWRNRAVTVARTETIGALNAGRHDAFAQVAADLDEDLEQMWLSTIDARTRPAHAAADQQRVPIGQPFTVGGASLMFPGDPTGPAAQVINCRCTTLLVEPGEEVDLTGRSQYGTDDWDAWHEAQAAGTPAGQELPDPPPRDLETEARQRQARIDGARTSGGAAAELDEIATSGASARAVEHRIAAQVARGALPPDVADEMRAALAAGDLDGVRAVAWRHAGRQGAVRVGDAGDVVPFDRRLHAAIDDDLRPGQQAIIVRPGTRWADEDLMLDKAAVDVATADDIARAARARLPSANAPDLGDLLDSTMAGRDRSGTIDKATFGRWMEGDFAGLRVVVTRADVDWRFGGVRVQGSIRNAEGKSIGRFSRAFGRDEDGRLYVVHELLKVQRQYQGAGFQAQFNGNLLDWYRRSGAAYVKVGANIDVGGYTWARAGYDFATVYDALDLFSRLQNRLAEVAGLPLRQLRWLDDARTRPAYVWDGPAVFDAKPAWTQAQLRKAFRGASDDEIARQLRIGREFVDGLAGRTFGDDLPSAYELSQLGRWSGADKDDVWIGKLIMLGSHWAGVLWL